MTQKEKAKAYDEVLEKAKSWYIDAQIDFKKSLENLFPELAMSEDERIRKNIISWLKNIEGQTIPINDYNSAIAWLEKTVPIEEEDERIRKAIISGMKSLQEKGMYTEFAHIPMGDVFAWLEKQGKKTNPYSGVSFEYNGNIWGMCARDNGVDILLDKQLFKHLEKQDIQKEINLVEILKHYPKETELYSPLYGKLWLAEVDEEHEIITCYKHPLDKGCTRAIIAQEDTVSFFSNGTTGLPDYTVSKDCMLFLYDIEKQDEQKPVFEMKTPEESLCIDTDTYNKIVDECIYDEQKTDDKVEPKFNLGDKIRIKTPSSCDKDMQVARIGKDYYICNHIGQFSSEVVPFSKETSYEIIEQNPADKVEPKFKIGDLVVDNCGYVWKIKGILNQFYILEGVEGGESRPTIEWVNKTFHLWTIKDAKAGDVLAINWHEGDNSWEKIIIFKKYHNKGVKGLCNMPCVEGYGNTFKNGKLAINEEVPYYSKTWTYNLHPATIKQCDTLFVKMKESGYEWDAEKKEPKKIEQMHNECNDEEELSCFESALFTAFSYAWQSYLLGEEVNVKQWVKEQSKELLDAAKEDLKEHNLAWNEEDIRNIENIDSVLYYDKDLPVETCIRLRNWLKSIKDRVGCEANIL